MVYDNLTNKSLSYTSIQNEKVVKLNQLFENFISNRNELELLINEIGNERVKAKLNMENKIILELQSIIGSLTKLEIKEGLVDRLFEFINYYENENNVKINLKFTGENLEFKKELLDNLYIIIRKIILNIFEQDKKIKCFINITSGLKSDQEQVLVEMEFDSSIVQYIDDMLNNESFAEDFLFDIKEKKIKIESFYSKSSYVCNALITKIDKHYFAIPLNQVETIINGEEAKIGNSNNYEIIVYRDKVIRLIRLNKMLNIGCNDGRKNIVIVKDEDKQSGIIFDEVIGQKSLIVKPLNNFVKGIKEYVGASVIGDGKIAFVLNVNGIIRM